MFAGDDGRVHAVYYLRGEGVAFHAGERQEGGNSPEVDTVEVRFRGSKGDQGQKVAVLVRMKGAEDKGGEAVEL